MEEIEFGENNKECEYNNSAYKNEYIIDCEGRFDDIGIYEKIIIWRVIRIIDW